VFAALAIVFTASAATLDERCVGTTKFDGTIDDAKAQLEAALERDQQFRKQTQSNNASATEPKPSFEARQQMLVGQQKVDLANLKLLDSIVCKLGWSGIDAVGQRASLAAFLIVQHAELAVQETYLPTLQKAAASKQAQPSQVAMLEDRINVRNKRPQRYASQLCFLKNGGYAWQPIENENEAAIDALRETVGLGAIKSYAANFKIEYTPPSKKACDK
jgi:hypothetical protein